MLRTGECRNRRANHLADGTRLHRSQPSPLTDSSAEGGFTIIELMVVVLIIAILIAIAIPTYSGARKRANDRAAQTQIRNTLGAEKAFYTGALRYADDSAGEMTEIEPGLLYGNGLTPAAGRRVWLAVVGDVVYLSARSESSRCYYVFDDPIVGTGYAKDSACGAADAQTYVTGGW